MPLPGARRRVVSEGVSPLFLSPPGGRPPKCPKGTGRRQKRVLTPSLTPVALALHCGTASAAVSASVAALAGMAYKKAPINMARTKQTARKCIGGK